MARKAITKKKQAKKPPAVSQEKKTTKTDPTDPMEPKKPPAKKVDPLEEQELKAEAWDRITNLRKEVMRLATAESSTKAKHSKAKADLDKKMADLMNEIDAFNRKLPLFDQEEEKKPSGAPVAPGKPEDPEWNKKAKAKKKAQRGGLDHKAVKAVTGQGETKKKAEKKKAGLWG